MTRPEHARDRLLADVELADSRLESFETHMDRLDPSERTPFAQRHAEIATRCDDLRAQMLDWPEVKIGTAGAVDDLSAAVDALEADFDAAQQGDAFNYRPAVDRQLRAWRARTDRLRLQGALATMDIRDDLDEVGSRLTDARAGVLFELRNATRDAKEVVVDLRDDVEAVLIDVRHAVERAADALVNSSKR